MRADGPRKLDAGELLDPIQPELAALINQLVAVRRHSFEAIDEVGRIRARAGERKVLAGTAIERRQSRAGHLHCRHPAPRFASERAVEHGLELGPLVLIHLLETERRHDRRPRTNCATPRTRRVTSGPSRPSSPDTLAASAASSSSRSSVSVGARSASAMTAA